MKKNEALKSLSSPVTSSDMKHKKRDAIAKELVSSFTENSFIMIRIRLT